MNQTFQPIRDFALSEVSWQDPYVQNALQKEEDYLLSLNPDRFLAGFFETAGKTPKAERYGGWEQTELRGHIFGHYLKAVSLCYERTGDSLFSDLLTYCFDELSEAQLPNGYLSAFPEELFDRIERGGMAWAPWYTLHKILSGLCEGVRATSGKTAWNVLMKLADWVVGRVLSWSEEKRETVLTCEYGGMNDALYEVYELSHRSDVLKAAHCFDEMSLYAQTRKMIDFRGITVLTGKHANTMIPKYVGAIRRYEILGDEALFYKEACEGFWNAVVRDHTYVTGGHSDLEHFGITGKLNAGRSSSNNETCNVYNLLKLTRELYKLSGDVKYMDFYEQAFLNMILASQNPETGMTTYFQSLLTGAFKIFGRPFDKFWCCTGTGMENFSKLGDSIYFHNRNTIFVNSYFSTTLHWKEHHFRLVQKADLYGSGTVTFTVEETAAIHPLTLCFRLPEWRTGDLKLTLNGTPVQPERSERSFSLSRLWQAGDTVCFSLQPALRFVTLPDAPDCAAFTYGPLVLSALMGTENMVCEYTGANNDVELTTVPEGTSEILETEKGPEEFLGHLEEHFRREPGPEIAFRLTGVRSPEMIFVPHFSQYRQRYGIYWHLR